MTYRKLKGQKDQPLRKRCADTHPPLQIPTSKYESLSICGGSVYSVNRNKFDVVISFEKGWSPSEMSMPWTPGIEFCYPITDGCAPGNPKNFKKLVHWVSDRLVEGDKVFVGCIGGHGRTGTFLSALVATLATDKLIKHDPIKYVRDNYCSKAVESETQVAFLARHFAAKPIEPSKAHVYAPAKSYSGSPRQMRFDEGSGSLVDVETRDWISVGDLWREPQGAHKKRAEKRTTYIETETAPKVRMLKSAPTTMSIHGSNSKVV